MAEIPNNIKDLYTGLGQTELGQTQIGRAVSDVYRRATGPNRLLEGYFGDAGATLGTNLTGFGGKGFPMGYSTLLDILATQGKTDPRLMNRQISEIQRGTQTAVDSTQGQLSQAGLQGSGAGQAILAALGQSGERRIADVHAQEAQAQEERKRNDLLLLKQMLIDPTMQAAGISEGVSVQNQAMQNQQQGQKLQALGTLASVAAIMMCWVAREVVPNDWKYARHYIVNMAPPEFTSLYGQYGPALAKKIRQNPEMKAELRPHFETIVSEAKKDLEVNHG